METIIAWAAIVVLSIYFTFVDPTTGIALFKKRPKLSSVLTSLIVYAAIIIAIIWLINK